MKVFRSLLSIGVLLLLMFNSFIYAKSDPTAALLLIDIQEFYFPGGHSELVNPEAASLNAQKLLKHFRDMKQLVVHVKHKSEKGSDIHEQVKPIQGEKIFEKSDVNSFQDPKLHKFLKKNKIEHVVICGMQTHMCVEAAARAAFDLGYTVTLIHDACATKNLDFNGTTISSQDVHNSTFATLGLYVLIAEKGKIVDTETFLSTK